MEPRCSRELHEVTFSDKALTGALLVAHEEQTQPLSKKSSRYPDPANLPLSPR